MAVRGYSLGWSFTIAHPHTKLKPERWKHTSARTKPSRKPAELFAIALQIGRIWEIRLMWTENVLKTELFENYRETTAKIRNPESGIHINKSFKYAKITLHSFCQQKLHVRSEAKRKEPQTSPLMKKGFLSNFLHTVISSAWRLWFRLWEFNWN